MLTIAPKPGHEGFISNPFLYSKKVKGLRGLPTQAQTPLLDHVAGSWNHRVPCPKNLKPVSGDHEALFPRPMFMKTDYVTVYAALGPRGSQGVAICKGMDTA